MPASVRNTRPLTYTLLFVWLILLFIPGAHGPPPTAVAQPLYLRRERAIKASDVGVARFAGLAFSPTDSTLIMLDAGTAGGVARTVRMTTLADRIDMRDAGALDLASPNLAFDGQAGRLIAFDQATGELVALNASSDGRTWSKTAWRDPKLFGVDQPRGLAVDPADRRLFLLDSSSTRIVGVPLDFEAAAGPVLTIELPELKGAQLRGLAFSPSSEHLYTFDQGGQALYELTTNGQVVATRDLTPLRIGDLRGMVFAPSGDPTDDSTALDLYLADGGSAGAPAPWSERIVEVALDTPAPIPASESATLVHVISSAAWSPPSPDPSGIVYLPSSGQLLVSDGEVDEMPQYFTGDNLFEMTLSGHLQKTYSTIAFSNEPTDVTVNPHNGHWFFSHDGGQKIDEVDLGHDGRYGTADDKRTSFSTLPFNCVDPEGVAFGNGKLFIADGHGKEVFIVDPGGNGRFEGRAPGSDDRISHFDTSGIGQPDPEGVEFDPDTGTLFLVSNDRHAVVTEVTTSGHLLRTIDISSLNARAPAGLAYAPSSRNAALKSLYIVDRGVDNNDDPSENDGKIFEIMLAASPATRTPTPTTKPSQRHTRYLPLVRR